MVTHNPREIDNSELFSLISSISKYMDHEMNLYALGGTALTLLNIKPSTRDIDINIDTYKEFTALCKIFEEIGFEKKSSHRWITQENLVFDIFYGSNMMGTQLLSDCLSKSKFIKSFGKINLYTLSLEDIIISKLARGDPRDFEDIKSILANEKINMKKLIKRYKETMENSTVAFYKRKLLDLIDIKFNQWSIPIDAKLIHEVSEWNE